MAFHLIDLEHWDRKEFYLHFINEVVCSYSVHVDLDISPLKGHKLYPAMLWLLTDTVNDFEEFRTHLSPGGVGIFDRMSPSYTVFNPDHHNFSCIWTEFCPDYPEFLERYREDGEKYRFSRRFAPKEGKPDNTFDVSMIPWLTFSAFHIQVHDSGTYLLPIFTMGKTFERDGRTLLPLSIQVHHAVCDGYHVARFTDTLQQKIFCFPTPRESR
jgi:chloramphenicol O-acetyltransferase type A